jgi:hypothetical protein
MSHFSSDGVGTPFEFVCPEDMRCTSFFAHVFNMGWKEERNGRLPLVYKYKSENI